METIKTKSGFSYKEKVYLSNGKSITKTFKRKTDAETWKRHCKSERDRNIALGIQPLKENLFFGQIFDLWMNKKIQPHRGYKTIADYKSIGNRHLIPFTGKTKIRSIERSHGSQLLMILKSQNLSNKTVNKISTVFKQILGFAEAEGYISKNPLKGTALLKLTAGRTVYLSKGEVLQLLRSNVFEDVYPILLVAINTGMRIGELTGLCWDRIDFENDKIEVSRSMNRIGLSETTKTHLVRYISMNDEVKEVLKALLRQQRSPRFVFAGNNGRPFNPDHFSQRYFQKALERAGLRRIKFHDLRHTYASQFMMNHGNIYDLQKILGHTKVEMTMRYAHLSPQHMKDAVNTVKLSANGDNSLSPVIALRRRGDEKLAMV